MNESTCVLESDWTIKLVPRLLTIIVLMGACIWWLVKEQRETEGRRHERIRLQKSNDQKSKRGDNEVDGVERNAKVPDLLVVAEHGECSHRPSCGGEEASESPGYRD